MLMWTGGEESQLQEDLGYRPCFVVVVGGGSNKRHGECGLSRGIKTTSVATAWSKMAHWCTAESVVQRA